MGYTHYWRRKKTFVASAFARVVRDAALVLRVLQGQGVALRGPDGRGPPVLRRDLIAFNGDAQCGHEERSLGITWPAKDARGVALVRTQGSQEPAPESVAGGTAGHCHCGRCKRAQRRQPWP
jgi:hypothetical protein